MIGSTVNSAVYAGNGSIFTAYVIPFRYDAAGWVYVTVTDAAGVVTDLEQVTDYTLAGSGPGATGTFTTTAAIPSTSTVTVYREAPGIQTLSLPANTPLPAVAVEAQLDRLAMAAQDSVTARQLTASLQDLELTPGPQGDPGEDGANGTDGADGTNGLYAFTINEAGNLILIYDGPTAPDFEINESGHLIYNF